MATAPCQAAQRDTIRAYRASSQVLVVVEGELPSPGFSVKIVQRPERIFPPFYEVQQCPLPGFFAQVIVPYKVSLTVNHPEDQDVVTVFHADGKDEVKIQAAGEDLSAYDAIVGGDSADRACPDGSDQATGFSKALSFDEAFADAIAKLPPIEAQHPDMLETVRVAEIGGLFGGIAGFHDMYVRVCRTHD